MTVDNGPTPIPSNEIAELARLIDDARAGIPETLPDSWFYAGEILAIDNTERRQVNNLGTAILTPLSEMAEICKRLQKPPQTT